MENNLFFTTLPKNKKRGPLVNTKNEVVSLPMPTPVETVEPQEPQIQQPAPLTNAMPSPQKGNTSKLVAVVIILISLLALGGAGFFAYKKFFGKTQKPPSQDSQTNQPNNVESSQNSTPLVTTPKEWQLQYFNNNVCSDSSLCGDAADPDHDGLTNLEEFGLKTDPNNPDSDGDKLADGDEVNIFGGSPLKSHTFGGQTYSDTDNAIGGFDPTTYQRYTTSRLSEVKAAMQRYGLHKPTIATLGEAANTVYNLNGSTSTSLPSGLDSSSQAKLDRDTQRSDNIKKMGAALLLYKKDKGTFPQTTDFNVMVNSTKSYFDIATNTRDPINQPPYVYQYSASPDGNDFTLIYQSETQGIAIKYKAADAQRDSSLAQANQNDDTRGRDLENIRSALLVYSSANVAGSQQYVFPTTQQYKTALVPKYISVIPKDPKTGQDYEYQVASTFDSFTLKAVFENPDPGTVGFVCDQDECKAY